MTVVPAPFGIAVVAILFLTQALPADQGRWSTNWPDSAPVSSVATDSNAAGVVYAGAGAVFRSADSGKTWTACGDGPAAVTAVVGDPHAADIVYPGTRAGKLFRSADACQHWSVLFERYTGVMTPPPVRFLVIHPDDSRVLFLDHASSIRLPGDLYRSEDAGNTWTTVLLPQYAATQFLTALVFDPVVTSVVYSATDEEQGFYKSVDGSASWFEVRNEISLGHVSSLVVDAETRAIYAGLLAPPGESLPAAGVWPSVDGGVSFSMIAHESFTAGVNDLVVDPSKPGVIFAATVGTGVLVTRDAGKTWTPLNDGLPPLAIRKLALDSLARSLHAATDAGVFDFELLPERPPLARSDPRRPPVTVPR